MSATYGSKMHYAFQDTSSCLCANLLSTVTIVIHG